MEQFVVREKEGITVVVVVVVCGRHVDCVRIVVHGRLLIILVHFC